MNIAPQPVPGSPQRTPSPIASWADADLVRMSVDMPSDAEHRISDQPYVGVRLSDFGGSPTDELDLPPAEGIDAFERIDARSLADAVTAASKLAAAHPIRLNIRKPDGAEETTAAAVAVLQAHDGAWYVTGLAQRDPEHRGFGVIDNGYSAYRVTDVQQVHPDVKAVVGRYSWVNFTNERITPKLAGAPAPNPS